MFEKNQLFDIIYFTCNLPGSPIETEISFTLIFFFMFNVPW